MGIGHWALDIRHGHEIKRKSLSFYTRYNFFMLKLTYFRLFMYVHTIRNWAAPGTAMLETTNSKYFQHSYVVTACAHCLCFSAHCFCFCFHRFDFHFLLCVSSFFFPFDGAHRPTPIFFCLHYFDSKHYEHRI